LRDKLDDVKQRDKRFDVKHILSEPEIGWSGPTGRVSKEIAAEVVKSSSYVLICGSLAFNEATVQLLVQHDVEMHCFQG